jgi:uncharacterized protein YjiS (DUF1127 family)
MSTTYGATGLGQIAVSTRRVSSFLKRYWDTFQEWRQRQRLGATLYDLSDRELMDIGITRGEIDYVASNRGIDPRGRLYPPRTFLGSIFAQDQCRCDLTR